MSSKEAKETKEFFPGIKKIEYNPKAKSDNVLCFKYYNPKEEIMGKTMEEWLPFSVAYWHSFRGTGSDQFGKSTITRPFDDNSDSLENAKTRMRAAFEFMSKLGVRFWCFHDRDIAPEGKTLKETNANLDEIVKLALQLQKETGIRCGWGTANLFSHLRYMNGAATNPDLAVFCMAAAQVRKAIEVTNTLGGRNYVFWGGREGYQSLLNTNVKSEIDHMAVFLKMAVKYKTSIGFKGQLLIEPKPKEPTSHQYDYDAQTVMGFLSKYDLSSDFKLNIEPNHTMLAGHSYEHDVEMAAKYKMLGSVDLNTGNPSLGWDTDQFPTDIRNTVMVLRSIVEMGGLGNGVLNFDAKLRRESTDLEDLFIAHIVGMDTAARALRIVAAMKKDGVLDQLVAERYSSWNTDFGKMMSKGELTLEECEKEAMKTGEPKTISGKQEKFEAIFNRYL
eukprot:TRINITY_DN4237_c0_g1_i1.p1 TRINITY_DN4237_c0_g1~~TRINITY_DN4237_c0_g1_i1.p1  ORF type:complete len:446 (+),score=84.48 TRINITY_DN4237_c0_g1_i1:99-1436(+)